MLQNPVDISEIQNKGGACFGIEDEGVELLYLVINLCFTEHLIMMIMGETKSRRRKGDKVKMKVIEMVNLVHECWHKALKGSQTVTHHHGAPPLSHGQNLHEAPCNCNILCGIVLNLMMLRGREE